VKAKPPDTFPSHRRQLPVPPACFAALDNNQTSTFATHTSQLPVPRVHTPLRGVLLAGSLLYLTSHVTQSTEASQTTFYASGNVQTDIDPLVCNLPQLPSCHAHTHMDVGSTCRPLWKQSHFVHSTYVHMPATLTQCTRQPPNHAVVSPHHPLGRLKCSPRTCAVNSTRS
jgi:hypothetical protein